jgi:hypothetical protein
MHRVGYTTDGACGNETREQPVPDQPMVELPLEPVGKVLTPYERHLALSKNRRQAAQDTWVEIDA